MSTRAEFSRIVGVSRAAVTQAVKKGRLDVLSNGDIDDQGQKTKSFLESNKIQQSTGIDFLKKPSTEQKSNYDDPAYRIGIAAKAQLELEKAKREKQARIKLEMQNATRRADLYTSESVMTLMLYLDKLHGNLKRLASSEFDELQRKVLAIGKLSPELKREWNNHVDGAIHTAKLDMIDLLNTLAKEQARV